MVILSQFNIHRYLYNVFDILVYFEKFCHNKNLFRTLAIEFLFCKKSIIDICRGKKKKQTFGKIAKNATRINNIIIY